MKMVSRKQKQDELPRCNAKFYKKFKKQKQRTSKST